MTNEARVAAHYTRGRLEEAIFRALRQAGKDLDHLDVEDLAPVDEFHVGGLEATRELAVHMELRANLHLLDIGSGIGGPARYFAAKHGCRVTAVDLTEEFVQVAKRLTSLVKLEHLVEFHQASALALPFESEMFDGGYMIHVGMNIADKLGVYREVRRVVKRGGLLVLFDIMGNGDGRISYPVPWALTEETSFVTDVETYRDALQRAGFRVEQERSRKSFAIEFTERAVAQIAQGGTPVIGLQLLIGDKTPLMMKNMLSMMREGLLEPVELYARAV
jgi:ubiquinone/menaquinone biosynthesis C-methylase UbiE